MTAKDAMELLKSVQNKLTTQLPMCATMTLDNILKDLKMDIEMYTNALRISQKGQHIILKCDVKDIFINACNRDILALWQGNTDLQYVVDEYSTVMYVCSYMMKGEKALGETLKRVANECRNDDLWTQMKKIKKEFLGKRVLGAPESAMRVLSMWLMKKSRKVVTVNTNMKDERVSLPKPGYRLAQLAEDDEDVFATSIIDRYQCRLHTLNDMCLAAFAVNYDPLSGSMLTELPDDVPASAGNDQVTHEYGNVAPSHENDTTDEESDNDDNHFPGATDTNVDHVDVTPPNHNENEYADFHQGNFGVTSDKDTTIHLLGGLGKMRKRKWESILCIK